MANKSNDRELELYTISQLMSTEHGRKFMFRCLQHCGFFENIFNIHANQHAFNAGLRSHGVWLERELREANLDNYLRMLGENENER